MLKKLREQLPKFEVIAVDGCDGWFFLSRTKSDGSVFHRLAYHPQEDGNTTAIVKLLKRFWEAECSKSS